MIRASWLALGVSMSGLVVFAACSSSDDDNSSTAGASRKGEACQKTSDCATGLACLPNAEGSGGTCTVGVFNITQTGKECAIIECQVPKDCCGTPPANCTTLQEECAEETDAGLGIGATGICEVYKEECVCDDTKLACISNKCKTNCATDTDCGGTGSTSKCLGGTCGQCSVDTDCTTIDPTYTCVNAQCQPPCQTDGDCSGFDRCVSGKCIAGGCQADRECVYATQNVESTCGTDGKCIIPCQTDLECGNPKDYQFFSCIAGKCQYVGCNEDKDCQFYFDGSGSTVTTSSSSSSSGSIIVSTGGTNSHIVCQPQTSPSTPTTPAQR